MHMVVEASQSMHGKQDMVHMVVEASHSIHGKQHICIAHIRIHTHTPHAASYKLHDACCLLIPQGVWRYALCAMRYVYVYVYVYVYTYTIYDI